MIGVVPQTVGAILGAIGQMRLAATVARNNNLDRNRNPFPATG